MNDIPHDRETAAEIFLKVLLHAVRHGVVSDVSQQLRTGPAGRKPREKDVRLHEWFKQLKEQDQQHVLDIALDAVDATLFSTLAVLDGVAGGYPVPNTISDFALYLQIYPDDNSERQNMPQTSVRINPTGALTDLHDMYNWMIESDDTESSGEAD